jgi:SAM-dependent methyltransferase
LSSHAIELCRHNFPVTGLEFRTGDAENIPYPDEFFDGVVNVESSHCYPNFERFATEVHRVLVPGGRFAIADARPAGEIEEWRRQLARAGFQELEACDITLNVLAAMRRTSAFKQDFARRHVAGAQRDHFCEFMGVEGSWYFESLRRGEMRYHRLLFKNQKARGRISSTSELR